MTPASLNELALRMMSGWGEAFGLRLVIGGIGLLIALLTAWTIRRRECSALAAVLWGLAGIVLIVFACVPQAFIRFVISTDYMIRIRVIVGALSLLVLLITLEAIRRTYLQERYAFLWVTTALVMFLCVIFPNVVDLLRAVMGMSYVTAIVAVASTFLVLVAFHFSISMSTLQSKQTKIAQRLAIVEADLKKLQQEAKATGDEANEPDAGKPTSVANR